MVRITLAIFAALALAACTTSCSGSVQTYAGDSRDESQIAVILPENSYNRARDSLVSAGGDGEVRVRVGGLSLGGTSNRFDVLPGRHALSVVYLDRTTPIGRTIATRAVTLPLDAQAGHTYAIRGTATFANGRPTVTIWAVDGLTRRTVASVVVPETHVVVGTPSSEWDFADK